MVLLSLFGSALVLLWRGWRFSGVALVLLWLSCSGLALVLFWFCSGLCSGAVGAVFVTALVLLGLLCSGVAFVLFWFCSGPGLAGLAMFWRCFVAAAVLRHAEARRGRRRLSQAEPNPRSRRPSIPPQTTTTPRHPPAPPNSASPTPTKC